ncbi:MAG: PCRF domain-containing protein, partial [Lachnospiraceae bacterium]|nr:PCRF domain-containing protein [Lachnospiraceae bacterium]
MFDKLEDLVNRLEELNLELTDPDVIADQERYRRYMKEQNELMPIVEKYQEYKAAKEG